MQELVFIQAQLKAPKTQYNSFGKYPYRSCEDILQAVKPLLFEQGCYLTLDDDIVEFDDDLHVKTTAMLVNSTGERVVTHGFGTIDYDKKGMDASQAVGAAGSYARKYALNGLFAIDDTKDADAMNTHGKDKSKAQKQTQTQPQSTTDDMVDGVPLADIEAAVMCCNSTAELTDFYKEHMEWKDNKRIMAVFTRRKEELNGNR